MTITVTNLTHTAARVQYAFEHKRIRIEELCDPDKILHIDSKVLDEAEAQEEPAELFVETEATEEKDEEAGEDLCSGYQSSFLDRPGNRHRTLTMPSVKIEGTAMTKKTTTVPENYNTIRTGIVELLKTARSAAARNVNSIMTAVYWDIGRRIVKFEQDGEHRAEYGDQLIEQLAGDLTSQFGRGFGRANLWQMRAFYRAWPEAKILQTLSGESITPFNANNIEDNSSSVLALASRFPLPWSAYVRLLSVRNSEARTFYETEALRSGWSIRQLDRQIGTQFYERMALSQNKAAMLEKTANTEPGDLVTPEEAIKDPFVLEFLDLKDEYSESDLEQALIHRLTDFLLELGDDFAFLGRQRRLRIDDTWFRIDLIFFHRRLRALVIVDLKVGRFSYADAGQMHLYLNYASEHWMKPGENPPVGLILCAEKGAAEAHYALDNLPNKVLAAEYQTVLPDEKLIAQELERSRRELENGPSLRRSQEQSAGPVKGREGDD